jgi:hypothetical protein
MSTASDDSAPGAVSPWWTSFYWSVVGVLYGLGLVSVLTIGVYLLVAAGVLTALGVVSRPIRSGPWPLALAGAAAGPWTVGWLNRNGPGTVCENIAGGVSCVDQWSPWPFAAAGLAAFALGIGVLFVRSRSATGRASAGRPA